LNSVVLFHTCLINEFFPDVGFAVVKVLERLGCSVDVPMGQTCCGQPAFNGGFAEEARVAARHTIEVLEPTDGPIVVPSGSCGDMLIHQFPALFVDHPEWQHRARAVADRCVEFSAFTFPRVERLGRMQLRTTVAYHPSCHLARGLSIDREPRGLMNAIAGVETTPLVADDECCGFGGLFSIKHADISTRMLERKLDHVDHAAPQRMVSCDMGCLLHIGGGLQRRGSPITVQHLAQLLAEALE
jgi:L-lactate dehydrogenase complex protein LldE